MDNLEQLMLNLQSCKGKNDMIGFLEGLLQESKSLQKKLKKRLDEMEQPLNKSKPKPC